MELNEMEKRMLYQTEGCERYAVINELFMASQYAGDPAHERQALPGAWAFHCRESETHYGTWMGSQKQPSQQERLRWAVDAVLEEKPKDFEELLKKLEAAGIEVNRERRPLCFRLSLEDRYTRCDTLKGDYTEQAIKERIAGTRTVKPHRTVPPKQVSKVGLLVDIEAAVRSGKGPWYERWAKMFNLKRLSQAVIWLKGHGGSHRLGDSFPFGFYIGEIRKVGLHM